MTDEEKASTATFRAEADAAWTRFRSAVAEIPLGDPTPSGWLAREMLAHVAFWLETVPPFVSGAFRGDPSAFQVTFPSGYVAGNDDWPSAQVHNEREAAWARTQSDDAVLARADAAFTEMRRFLETVTEEELAQHRRYFDEIVEHLDEHRAHDLTR